MQYDGQEYIALVIRKKDWDACELKNADAFICDTIKISLFDIFNISAVVLFYVHEACKIAAFTRQNLLKKGKEWESYEIILKSA